MLLTMHSENIYRCIIKTDSKVDHMFAQKISLGKIKSAPSAVDNFELLMPISFILPDSLLTSMKSPILNGFSAVVGLSEHSE